MLPIISGTVRSSVKLAELNQKWMQKKESGNIFQKEMTPEQRQVSQFQEDLKKMRENNEMNSITYKMQSGQKLTPEEIEYLQKNNPQLYQEYKAIQAEKEAYERELRNCKTQEEADTLKMNKMNGYLSQAKSISNNPNIPKAKKIELLGKIMMHVSGIQEVHLKFVESGQYAALPTQEEEAQKHKEEAQRSEKIAKELGADEQMQEEVHQPCAEAEDAQIREEVQQPEAAAKEGQMQEETAEKIQQPAVQQPDTDIFAEVRKELTGYIMANRPNGLGLDLLADEFREIKHRSDRQ